MYLSLTWHRYNLPKTLYRVLVAEQARARRMNQFLLRVYQYMINHNIKISKLCKVYRTVPNRLHHRVLLVIILRCKSLCALDPSLSFFPKPSASSGICLPCPAVRRTHYLFLDINSLTFRNFVYK